MEQGDPFGKGWAELPKLLMYSLFLSAFIFLVNLSIVLFVHEARLKVILFQLPYPLWDLLAALALFYAAKRSALRARRLFLAWGLLAGARLQLALGEMTVIILTVRLGAAPFPSLADGFFLAFGPLFLIGILLLPALRLKPLDWLKTGLDMSIILFASVLALWNYWLGPLLATVRNEKSIIQVLFLAYPVENLLLLWALLVLLYRPPEGQKPGPLLLLALGIGAQIVTSCIYGRQSLLGTFMRSDWLGLGWLLTNLIFLLAGIWQATSVQPALTTTENQPATAAAMPQMNPVVMYLPYTCLVAVYLLLVWRHFYPLPMSFAWMAVGVGGIIGFVLLRQMLMLWENHMQAQTLRQINQALQGEIGERQASENALRESEARYRFLADAVPQQVWTAQPDGALDYINQRVLTYFACTYEQMLASGWQAVIHPDDWPMCLAHWRDSLQTGEPYEVEFRLRRAADGVYRCHLGRAYAMHSQNGAIVKWLGTNTDVDALKKAEAELLQTEAQLRQSQRLESVGRLAGGIAHDFNNMLTAITGYSDLTLRRLTDDDPLRRNIEQIKKAAEHSALLTHQLLAFSRQQILQPKVLCLNQIIRDISTMLQRLIGEDVDLSILLYAQGGAVKVDPGQLTQVITNLVVNARDAMPLGGKLTIETANVYLDERQASRHIAVKPGAYLTLAVSDTGAGIDAKTQQHIFDPFFTTKEAGKGTGLGLATVYGIVKQSGGSIWVYSEVGHGTTFKIYLPQVNEPAEAIEDRDPTAAMPQGRETILIVEDEDMVRTLSRQVLELCGYTVREAQNGVEALSICKQQAGKFNLLITDVVMPQMGGRELAERLAQTYPQMRVLFTSGYTNDAMVRHGVIDVGTHFIQKPFTPDALAHKVREVLDDLPVGKEKFRTLS